MNIPLFDLIKQEHTREQNTINLIASENYVSKEIRELTGSILTNKYAEGYPGHRYYGGCEVIDSIEQYAIDLGKQLFKSDHFNVQPHSGSNANMAAYFSQLIPGDTILGMSLSSGGHLTHGHKVNFSGKFYHFVPYTVDPQTELIDYDELEQLAFKTRPRMIVVGASAYSRIIDYARCAQIAKQNNALLLVDIAHVAGLIAAGLHPNPSSVADIVTGTTHKTLRGPRGGLIYGQKLYGQSVDKAVMPGIQGGPLMHVIAAKAECFRAALLPEFKEYQQKVLKNARLMAQTFTDLGYRIVSGGTDTHLFLIDLKRSERIKELGSKELFSGKKVEEILGLCNITVNRNLIPFDDASPLQTSGIRIGTSAITTRGFGANEVGHIVQWIDKALQNHESASLLNEIRGEVIEMCRQFPIP